ncbi:2-amino-4-hydroxy-6-hydroxymethyldihydropteridine diphosphokinase [Aquirhabdus sp.]|uniref:2-amino-4-hydroxy-6- hydroxymethyldihydropteridine diphosphokinase n=1 Tax=Aquirhabdus sp. TaxID=2824160 RepID=UPI00396D04C8
MRYWLALGSNDQPQAALDFACASLGKLGAVNVSSRYEFPPRSGIGVDYINMAVQLDCAMSIDRLRQNIFELETNAGRIRRSNTVRLDIDLIAWQEEGQAVVFDPNRFPLPQDVILPMQEIWVEYSICMQKFLMN